MDGMPPQRNLLRYATVGIEFLVVFLLFFFAGWQLDRWVGWSNPALTVLFGITGFAVAMYRLTKQGWGILKDGRFGQGGDEDKPDDQA
jgi:hypothetical protein